MAVLKWVFSALCTTARFQNRHNECPFCDTYCGDHIDHIIGCSALSSFAFDFWGFPINASRFALFTLTFQGCELSIDLLGVLALDLYASMKAYNCCRVAGQPNAAFYHYTLTNLAGMCQYSRGLINSHRNSSLCSLLSSPSSLPPPLLPPPAPFSPVPSFPRSPPPSPPPSESESINFN